MKVFLVVVFFLFFIVLLVSRAASDVDLTPDTPYEANPAVFSAPRTLPSGGVCGREYVIRSGDTLFSVAQGCGLTLQDLLAANPTITDPNVIYPDQRINIPAPAAAPAPTAALPDAAAAPAPASAGSPPTQSDVDEFLNAFEGAPPANQAAGERNTYRPGTPVDVLGDGLLPGVVYNLYIGKAGDEPVVVAAQARTSPDGAFTAEVLVPIVARPGENWAVTLVQEDNPANRSLLRVFTVR